MIITKNKKNISIINVNGLIVEIKIDFQNGLKI